MTRSVRVLVFVVEKKRGSEERRDGLYSEQERCLGAKREWRSMNNGGQKALKVGGRIRQAVLEEAGNRVENREKVLNRTDLFHHDTYHCNFICSS